jgi:hypothetical protein
MVATVAAAAALPFLHRPGCRVHPGRLAGSRTAPDGRDCHLLGLCRDPKLPVGDVPIYRSTRTLEHVVVDCALGNYVKLSAPVIGWAEHRDVLSAGEPTGCYAGPF